MGLNWLTTAENQRERPIRKFSVDPASSIRTSIADPIFADPVFPRLLKSPKKFTDELPQERRENQLQKSLRFRCAKILILHWVSRRKFLQRPAVFCDTLRLPNSLIARVRARQRSGEGVVRGNGRPKGCFWRVRFFSAPLRFALKTPENLKWEEKKRTLQNTLLGDRFSARRLLRSFGAPPQSQSKISKNQRNSAKIWKIVWFLPFLSLSAPWNTSRGVVSWTIAKRSLLMMNLEAPKTPCGLIQLHAMIKMSELPCRVWHDPGSE